AYWGNKVAQYDLGEVYLHGMGRIRADPARGVAWLGIADEEHEPDYDKALVSAYKSLKPEERKRAEGLWKELQEKYADKLTLARATRLSRMPTIPDAPVPPPPKVTPTRTPSRSTVTIPPVTSRTRRSWSLTWTNSACRTASLHWQATGPRAKRNSQNSSPANSGMWRSGPSGRLPPRSRRTEGNPSCGWHARRILRTHSNRLKILTPAKYSPAIVPRLVSMNTSNVRATRLPHQPETCSKSFRSDWKSATRGLRNHASTIPENTPDDRPGGRSGFNG